MPQWQKKIYIPKSIKRCVNNNNNNIKRQWKWRNLTAVTNRINDVGTKASEMVLWNTQMGNVFNIFATNSKDGQIHLGEIFFWISWIMLMNTHKPNLLIDVKFCLLCPKYLALTNKNKESANVSGNDSNWETLNILPLSSQN